MYTKHYAKTAWDIYSLIANAVVKGISKYQSWKYCVNRNLLLDYIAKIGQWERNLFLIDMGYDIKR